MTFEAVKSELSSLTVEERLELLELISQSIRQELRTSTVELRGILASDEEQLAINYKEDYIDYLEEKYR